MNRFFNNTIDLVAGAKARASEVESNFSAVEVGFDAAQVELDGKAGLASPVFTGVPTAPTAATVNSSTQIATTAFVKSVMATAPVGSLPAAAGKALQSLRVTANELGVEWAPVTLTPVTVTTTTQTAVAGNHYVLTNEAATTVTLPAGAEGATVAVTTTGTLTTNVIARNGSDTIMELAEDMTLDKAAATVTLRFLSNSWRVL